MNGTHFPMLVNEYIPRAEKRVSTKEKMDTNVHEEKTSMDGLYIVAVADSDKWISCWPECVGGNVTKSLRMCRTTKQIRHTSPSILTVY